MRFRDEYWFLSNFYPTKTWGYPSAEHAYQAAKTDSEVEQKHFMTLATGQQAKAYGKRVTLTPRWKNEDYRLKVMRTVVYGKFAFNEELRKKLVATGDLPLVEENWWGDTFWGTCNGKGQNWLGRILMETRAIMTCRACKQAFLPDQYDEDSFGLYCDECQAPMEPAQEALVAGYTLQDWQNLDPEADEQHD